VLDTPRSIADVAKALFCVKLEDESISTNIIK